MKILSGDIGGTKTLLQITAIDAGHSEIIHEQRFDSHSFEEFATLLSEFLENTVGSIDNHGISTACIGVAGPVRGITATVTNLPWVLNSNQIAAQFHFKQVRLINDFQAIGYGIETLLPDDVMILQTGTVVENGVRAIIGAGTGLGEGILVWCEDAYRVLPSEGGHVNFGPVDEQQIELLRYLSTQYDAVTYEHLCSGPGLRHIYQFLRQGKTQLESAQFRQALDSGDAAAVISEAALNKSNPLAVEAMALFCRIYGAQTGNLALTCMANGGVYIAGGIAPKIIDYLNHSNFINAFHNKGKMAYLMEQFAIKVVLNSQVGLQGAAAVAKHLAAC